MENKLSRNPVQVSSLREKFEANPHEATQIFRDGQLIGDKTNWSQAELGSNIVTTIVVNTPNELSDSNDDHVHVHEGDPS